MIGTYKEGSRVSSFGDFRTRRLGTSVEIKDQCWHIGSDNEVHVSFDDKTMFRDNDGYARFNDVIEQQKVCWYIAKKFIFDISPDEFNLPFDNYQVHHINGDKSNDRPSNLQILTRKDHIFVMKGRVNYKMESHEMAYVELSPLEKKEMLDRVNRSGRYKGWQFVSNFIKDKK